ncbi:hypothetical protein GQ457_02G036960 [Hibiscus cannabinus]
MASVTPDLHHRPRMSSPFNKQNKTATATAAAAAATPSFNPNQWTTQRQQQIYTSKLIQALRRHSPPSSASVAAKQVRETADRVLAVAAKGTMRWSRSILSATSAKVTKKHKKAKVAAGRRRSRRSEIEKEKRKSTVVERKLRVLGRLVPGCRKLAYSNLLDETSDYIAALEMQVRAMTDITEYLDGGGGAQPPAPADRLGANVDL